MRQVKILIPIGIIVFLVLLPRCASYDKIIEGQQMTLEKAKAIRDGVDRWRAFMDSQVELIRQHGDAGQIKFITDEVDPFLAKFDESLVKFKQAITIWEGLGIGALPPDGISDAEWLAQKVIEGGVLLMLLLSP